MTGPPSERQIYIRAFRMMAEDLVREKFLRTEEPGPTAVALGNDYLERAEAAIGLQSSDSPSDVVTS